MPLARQFVNFFAPGSIMPDDGRARARAVVRERIEGKWIDCLAEVFGRSRASNATFPFENFDDLREGNDSSWPPPVAHLEGVEG
ncbi:MAG: hypothetical protein ACREVP_06025 [Burkholderiales bacterium]